MHHPTRAANDMQTPKHERIPVTILTGFLGAGKTTLLNRILRERHGLRIAVIENELGAQSIDANILLQDSVEEIVQMDNGCLCCNVRGDLRRALDELAVRRANGALSFDSLVIETSGAADPGPVAQTLFQDPAVAAIYRLGGIAAVVDALHGLATLRSRPEARAQVAYADQIVVTKIEGSAMDAGLQAELASINPHAPHADARSPALIAQLVSQVRDGTRAPALGPCESAADLPAHSPAHAGDIQTISLVTEREFDAHQFEQFLAAAIEICGNDLYRCKGILFFRGALHPLILQGVQLSMATSVAASHPAGAARQSRIVLIGRDLPAAELKDSLRRCLVATDPEDADKSPPLYRRIGASDAGWLA